MAKERAAPHNNAAQGSVTLEIVTLSKIDDVDGEHFEDLLVLHKFGDRLFTQGIRDFIHGLDYG